MTGREACAHCGLPVAGSRPTAPAYCCSGCALAAQVAGAPGEEGQARWIMARLMLAGFLAMNVMLLSLTLYSVTVYDLDVSTRGQALFYAACRWLMLACTLAVLGLLGWPLARNAIEQLRARVFTTDVFILVGVAAAFLLSARHTFAGAGEVYYETATMLLVLVTIGRFLEARARASSGAAVADLLANSPAVACRVTGGGEETVPVEVVAVGDRLKLRPGDGVPVDGVVEHGAGDVDESNITGESRPVTKDPGDRIYAGTHNLDGQLIVRAVGVGADRVLARLARLLEEARRTRAPAQRLADRAAAVLLPATTAIAVLTAVYWFRHGGADAAILNALAVLLIACPCALGIATPLALWIALSESAKRGILVRSTPILEILSSADTIRLDKTGTLTTGEGEVQRIDTFHEWDPNAVLQLAGSVETASRHPTARTLVQEARRRGLTLTEPERFAQLPGRGVAAYVGSPPVRVVVGNAAFMRDEHVALPSEDALADGHVWIAVDGRVAARVAVAEAIRPTTRTALAEFRDGGYDIGILTGDAIDRAESLGRELSASVHAGLLPDEKVRTIRELMGAGRRVVMVGDGLNDAAALAAANVGIAMGCGADLTRESADVCLVGDDLGLVAWLLGYAKEARRIVRTNLAWAFGYNAVGLALAAAGLLTPVLAALAMVGSSAIVLINSLRLRQRHAPTRPRPVARVAPGGVPA